MDLVSDRPTQLPTLLLGTPLIPDPSPLGGVHPNLWTACKVGSRAGGGRLAAGEEDHDGTGTDVYARVQARGRAPSGAGRTPPGTGLPRTRAGRRGAVAL